MEKDKLEKKIHACINKLMVLRESSIDNDKIAWAEEYKPEKYEIYRVIDEMADFYKNYGIEFFLNLTKKLLHLDDRNQRGRVSK